MEVNNEIDPQYLAALKEANPQLAALFKPKPIKLSHCETYLNRFITNNPKMLELKEKVRKLKGAPDSVLIMGESGTGKELIANALHGDRTGKFQSINCAGLPEGLMESELFGHVRGAFTGATSNDKIGLMENAKDGTLFLDEIGELPMHVQGKLLRALNDKVIRKVGGLQDIKVNFRLVAATNQELNPNAFRNDLLFRINCFTLNTLPMKDRPEDIEDIIEELDDEKKIKDVKSFAAKLRAKAYIFESGNVRALQNVVRRYYILNEEP